MAGFSDLAMPSADSSKPWDAMLFCRPSFLDNGSARIADC